MAGHKPKVLSQSDQAFFEKWGGKKWMNRKFFREGPQKRYKRALDAFTSELAELGLDPGNAEALQEMLAVVLDKDGTFGAWFREHNFPVDKPDEFSRLCHAAAGALVSEYLHKEELPEAKEGVLLDAELRDQISSLLHTAVEQGELSAKEGREAGEEWWQLDDRPDPIETAREALEELLATDVNVAHKADPDVPASERQREIAKAALVQLQVSQLRKMAEDEELAPLGDKETLAELIVRKYKADSEAIAELVLKYTVPDVERGWATRLMPLEEPADLPAARTTLQTLLGTYMRLDVATWLVFNSADETSNGVAFDGDIRYYSVRSQREGDRPEIASFQRGHPIRVRLRQGQRWAVIDGKSATDVKRLRKALRHALGLHAKVPLDPKVPALTGDLATFDAKTIRMLHIIERGIRDEHIDYQSFRQAEFSRLDAKPSGPAQVSVRAVRLQGQHVMADPAACRYMIGGQTLSSVEFRVRYKRDLNSNDAFFTNVRIGLAEDHAFVLTAYADDATLSRELHRELVDRLRLALDAEIKPEHLKDIAKVIANRSHEAEPPDEVDIWGPSAGDGDGAAAGGTSDGDGDGASADGLSDGDGTATAGAAAGDADGSGDGDESA
jgi:hypothetical protein